MANKGSYLTSGQSLATGDYLVSANQQFFAIQQGDGNFCVYRGSGPGNNLGYFFGIQGWVSAIPVNPPENDFVANMQSDGNFCIYRNGQYFFGVQNWRNMSCLQGSDYVAILQDDGNFCVYCGTPNNFQCLVWQSNTANSLPAFMQPQQESEWCWAAVGTSVGLFFNTGSWTQCGTANACLNRGDCCSDPAGPCNQPSFLEPSLTSTKSCVPNSSTSGTEPTAVIEAQVNLGCPMCVRVAWNGGGAHFLAITGYSYPYSDPSQVTIDLQDSIYGASTMAYADFPAQYHGGGTWTSSYPTAAQP